MEDIVSDFIKGVGEEASEEAKAVACSKLVLLSDAASCVAGFEEQGTVFVENAVSQGVKKMTVAEFGETL